jgi:hypothetical protein
MTSERARAYGRVTRTLQELGPAKLLSAEQARIREAADALLFCGGLTADAPSVEAFLDVCELREHLIDSDRWTADRADELLDDLWACGPRMDARLATAA